MLLNSLPRGIRHLRRRKRERNQQWHVGHGQLEIGGQHAGNNVGLAVEGAMARPTMAASSAEVRSPERAREDGEAVGVGFGVIGGEDAAKRWPRPRVEKMEGVTASALSCSGRSLTESVSARGVKRAASSMAAA